MSGETNLNVLLQNMTPELKDGEFVITNIKNTDTVARADIVCEFKEIEGTTIIIERKKADRLGLQYDYVSSWITLNVHSSLEAVGFTAAFSTVLAKENISCNVIAGYYHDHIFVSRKDAEKALRLLTALSKA